MNASPLLPLDVASATFLLMTAAMAATTVLLLTSGRWVSPRWRVPVALSSLVPLVGVLHYGLREPRLAAGARYAGRLPLRRLDDRGPCFRC